jgi:hypothetical protein
VKGVDEGGSGDLSGGLRRGLRYVGAAMGQASASRIARLHARHGKSS